MFRPIALLLLGSWLASGLVACERPRAVAVRVTIPGLDSAETPVPGLAVVALPYDRDSVIRELERRASAPRPNTARLDTLFRRFRAPFAAFTALAYRAERLGDSVATLRARLERVPLSSDEYRELSTRLRRLSDSLRAVEGRRARAQAVLDSARGDFVSRSERLRTAVRLWEDSTYRGYDSIVRNLALARGHEPVTDTTGATGWAELTLPPGAWWLYARSFDAMDPNAEWYWNLPVRGDTVILSSETGRRQPRY